MLSIITQIYTVTLKVTSQVQNKSNIKATDTNYYVCIAFYSPQNN